MLRSGIKILVEWVAKLPSSARYASGTSALPKPGHASSWRPAPPTLKDAGNTPSSPGAVLNFKTWWMTRVIFNHNNRSVHHQPSIISGRDKKLSCKIGAKMSISNGVVTVDYSCLTDGQMDLFILFPALFPQWTEEMVGSHVKQFYWSWKADFRKKSIYTYKNYNDNWDPILMSHITSVE